MASAISIWILSDQKAGHENQSIGLAEGIGRLLPATWKVLRIEPKRIAPRNIASLMKRCRNESPPDLVIGTGHRTHLPLLWARWRFQVPTVVLMKPSLPSWCFDLCLVPEHDLRGKSPQSNSIATCGVLNRVSHQPERKQGRGLFLVGGPCKEYGWDAENLLNSIREITTAHPAIPWALTDSRRTPSEFLATVKHALPQVTTFSHQSTPQGWLPDQLAEASSVWTTQDSVSMIYEALSSGASVGLLPMPPIGKPSRLNYGIERLESAGMITRFGTRSASQDLPQPPRVLAETDRCAREVLARLFPNQSAKLSTQQSTKPE